MLGQNLNWNLILFNLIKSRDVSKPILRKEYASKVLHMSCYLIIQIWFDIYSLLLLLWSRTSSTLFKVGLNLPYYYLSSLSAWCLLLFVVGEIAIFCSFLTFDWKWRGTIMIRTGVGGKKSTWYSFLWPTTHCFCEEKWEQDFSEYNPQNARDKKQGKR